MPDRLEERLHADAAAPDVRTPDFDVMLASATARRRPRVWLPAAAAAAVLAGGATAGVAVLSDRPTSHAPASSVSAGPTAPFGDYTLHRTDTLVPDAVIATPGQPTQLQVTVSEGPSDDACYRPVESARAVETGTRIELVITGRQYETPSGEPAPACASSDVVTVDVALRRPLGNRAVYDATGTKLVLVDPTDLPNLTGLPTGFVQDPVDVAVPGAGQYLGTRVWRRGQQQLELTVGRPSEVFLQSRPTGHAPVGGAAATITKVQGSVCVLWPERSGRNRQLCGFGLDQATVLALARQLR